MNAYGRGPLVIYYAVCPRLEQCVIQIASGVSYCLHRPVGSCASLLLRTRACKHAYCEACFARRLVHHLSTPAGPPSPGCGLLHNLHAADRLCRTMTAGAPLLAFGPQALTIVKIIHTLTTDRGARCSSSWKGSAPAEHALAAGFACTGRLVGHPLQLVYSICTSVDYDEFPSSTNAVF